MYIKNTLTTMVVIGLILFIALPESQAQKTFSEGKVIRILVGFTPGGGVDTTARLVARHAAKYIPGKPNLIIQNMPGAGGRIALAYLYNIAKKDGLNLSVVPVSPPLMQILDKDRNFDVSKLTYLAGSAEPGIILIRDVTGVKTPSDLTKIDPAKLVIPGRASPDTSQMYLKTTLGLLGVKGGYRTTLGYRGTAQITGAMLRGEASMYGWSLVNTLKGGILYDPIQEGTIIPLWQTGQMDPQGKVVRDPRIDLPTFEDVYREIKGKPLSGVEVEASRFLGPGLRTLNRSVIMSPGVPENRVKTLRGAFAEMIKSPDFSRALERMTGFKWIWFDGKKAEKIRDGLLKGVSPEVLSYIKSVM
jgi:tripartite-type tricarboxylate transporter receptor subunit TctC